MLGDVEAGVNGRLAISHGNRTLSQHSVLMAEYREFVVTPAMM